MYILENEDYQILSNSIIIESTAKVICFNAFAIINDDIPEITETFKLIIRTSDRNVSLVNRIVLVSINPDTNDSK